MIERLVRLCSPTGCHQNMPIGSLRSLSYTTVFGLLLTAPPVHSFHGQSALSRRLSLLTLQRGLKAETLELEIQEAWRVGETDGILRLASQLDVERFAVQELVASTLHAIPVKGQAAGVLNAWIGSCCQLQDTENGAVRACQFLTAYDSLDGIEPDMVALSLVYTALTRPNLQPKYHVSGDLTLDRMRRLAKKQGGSKRRKSLAESTRKQGDHRVDQLFEVHGVQVLHMSDHDIIVNKPSGMVCAHRSKTTSGKLSSSRRKHQREGTYSQASDVSLEAALMDSGIPLSTINVDGRGMVHRIDRGTSGCIVLAKTDQRHAQLVSDFFLRNVKKDYNAMVSLPENDMPDEGSIDIPVQGRPALSHYTVEERLNSSKALLCVQTLTGRKHQVRVHCAVGLKAPIVGDNKYSPDKCRVKIETNGEKERFCLHASSLHVPGIPEVKAPIPIWWER